MILLPPACSHLVHVYFRLTGLTSPVRYVVSMEGLVMVAIWRSPFGVRPLPSALTIRTAVPIRPAMGDPVGPTPKKPPSPKNFEAPALTNGGPGISIGGVGLTPRGVTKTEPRIVEGSLTGTPPPPSRNCLYSLDHLLLGMPNVIGETQLARSLRRPKAPGPPRLSSRRQR